MKFYGQFNPPVDKVLYDRYFKNKFDCISIECGAFDGLTENCTKFFEENLNWTTINIEPLPHIFNKLLINRPKSINKNVALSNKNFDDKIRVYNIKTYGIYNTNASLVHLPKHKQSLEKQSNNNFKDFDVKCITYDSLIQNLKINKLDLFILDVEGHEYEVIDGMINATIFPEVFVIEHGHRTPKEIEEKLNCLPVKYKLDHISFVNSFFIKI